MLMQLEHEKLNCFCDTFVTQAYSLCLFKLILHICVLFCPVFILFLFSFLAALIHWVFFLMLTLKYLYCKTLFDQITVKFVLPFILLSFLVFVSLCFS